VLVRRLNPGNLPLFWKLLAPSIALTLVLGLAGSFAVARYLANEAQASLDEDLSRTAVGAEVAISDETDYLVETARVNTHVEGVQEALTRRQVDALAGFLGGAAAVRDRADLFAFTDNGGRSLVELRRPALNVVRSGGTAWAGAPSVRHVLRPEVHDVGDETASWFRDAEGTELLLVAAPVVDNGPPLGAAVVGTDLTNLVARAARQIGASVALYGPDGALLASSEKRVDTTAPSLKQGDTERRNGSRGSKSVATLFAPLRLHGGEPGVVGITLPRNSTSAFSGVGARVGAVFLVAIFIVVALGAFIARGVLRRVRDLLSAHRNLASGDLATRARAGGGDEFGDLSDGFNDMAEQLQASYRELEHRVAERTAELQRLYDETLEAAQARSEFFAAISHELRTPLFVIAGHAELMSHPELQPDEPGWEEEFGQTIHSSALDLLARVNDILDLAKLETKKLELELSDVDLPEVVRGLVGELAPLARQGRLRLRVDVDRDLPLVRADAGRLRDILRNLLANAIKYTPRGGEVVVSATAKTKRTVEVAVADTGIGIPAEAHDRLFEPFYQVPGITPQSKQTSTGLGLALAQRLAIAHGSSIRLSSEVGVGSTFSFTLRAVSSSAPPQRSTRARRRQPTASKRS
jgi:signal transduction histidine kinase